MLAGALPIDSCCLGRAAQRRLFASGSGGRGSAGHRKSFSTACEDHRRRALRFFSMHASAAGTGGHPVSASWGQSKSSRLRPPRAVLSGMCCRKSYPHSRPRVGAALEPCLQDHPVLAPAPPSIAAGPRGSHATCRASEAPRARVACRRRRRRHSPRLLLAALARTREENEGSSADEPPTGGHEARQAEAWLGRNRRSGRCTPTVPPSPPTV
jgi:hypothetical protein